MITGVLGGTGFELLTFDKQEDKPAMVQGKPSRTVTHAEIDGNEFRFLRRQRPGTPPHRIDHLENIRALLWSGADSIISTTPCGS